MRHIFKIFTFSLLLLNSPLFGQETYVLYQFETSSGIQWKTFGDVKVQPMYKGEIKNGVPNGQGLYSYPDGRKYFGQWKDGKIKHSCKIPPSRGIFCVLQNRPIRKLCETSTHPPLLPSSFFSCDWSGNWCSLSI